MWAPAPDQPTEPASWVILTDAEGMTCWVSADFTAATGYTLGDLLGRAPAAVLQPPLGAWQPQEQPRPTGQRKDGTPFFARSRIEPRLDPQGRLQGHVWLQTETSRALAAQHRAQWEHQRERAEARAAELELQQIERGTFGADAAIDDVMGSAPDPAGGDGERERIRLLLRWTLATQPETTVGWYQRDIDSDEAQWNDLLRALFDLEVGDPVPTTQELRALVHPDDLGALVRAWDQSLQDLRPANIAYRIRGRHGQLRWIHEEWLVGLSPQGRRRAIGHVRDISAAVSAAREAESLRQQLRMATELAQVGLLRTSLSNGAVEANVAARRMLGLPDSGPLHVPDLLARLHADDRPVLAAAFQQAAQGQGPPPETRVRATGPLGATRHIQVLHEAGRLVQGRAVSLKTALMDVSQATWAQQRETQLSESRDMALELAGLGVWELVEYGQDVVFDDNMLRIHGWHGRSPRVPLQRWLQTAHPQDRLRMQRRWLALQRGPVQRGRAEYRIVHDDGTVRWLVVSAARMHGPDGALAGVRGTTLDVTRQVSLRQAITTSLRRHQALFDGALNGILLADDHGRYIAANPAACQMLGYTQAEVLALSVHDITLPDGDANQKWRRSLDDKRQTGRMTLRHKSGRAVVAQYMSVSGIQPGVNLSVLEDVTARLQAEQALETTQQQLRALALRQQEELDVLRAELARDLHDELGQVLGALALEIDMAPEAVPGAQSRMRALLDTAMASVRDISRALRPATLDLGLLPALRALAHETSMRGDVDVATELPTALPELPENLVRALYRIAQEALTNTGRHARARHVTLRLVSDTHGLRLQVQDDGQGFDVSATAGGLGLVGMRERASQAGARLSIVSSGANGTTVSASWSPTQRPADDPTADL